MKNKHVHLALILVLAAATLSCSKPVDPDKLYTRCKSFLESNFIDQNLPAETKEGLLKKMQLACERARDECRAKPEGSRCAQHVKKYK